MDEEKKEYRLDTVFNQAVTAYLQIFRMHVRTKTLDRQILHKFLEEAYEQIFDIMHEIGERAEDIGDETGIMDEEDCARVSYEVIENLKKNIEEQIEEGDNSVGTDNLLRTHVDELEKLCGSSRAYLPIEEEDEDDESEEETQPNSLIPTTNFYGRRRA